MVKTQNEFWSEIGQDIWSVQDFSVNPDVGAANATAYCVWNKRVVWAHLPELKMSGRWTINLASPAGYTATYEGTYTIMLVVGLIVIVVWEVWNSTEEFGTSICLSPTMTCCQRKSTFV